MERGFAQADLVVEETYSTQAIEHAYLEPEAGLAYVDHDDVVTIVSPSQNITHHRHMLARILAKPISKVRFIMSPVGGGFGGKEDMIYQGMLALLAMKTRAPVRLVFTREESIISTAKRHPSRTTLRMGLTRDGRILASHMTMVCDGGAYGFRQKASCARPPSSAPGLTPSPTCASTLTASIPTTRRPAPSAPSARCRRNLPPNRISTSAPSGSASIPSRSGASTPCATARSRTPKQKLGSVSLTRCLDAAEKASGWEQGAPTARGATRNDLDRPDIRPPVALGARFGAVEKQEAAE